MIDPHRPPIAGVSGQIGGAKPLASRPLSGTWRSNQRVGLRFESPLRHPSGDSLLLQGVGRDFGYVHHQVFVVGGMWVGESESVGSLVGVGEVAQRPESDEVFSVLWIGSVQLHDEDDVRVGLGTTRT